MVSGLSMYVQSISGFIMLTINKSLGLIYKNCYLDWICTDLKFEKNAYKNLLFLKRS